MGRTKAIAATLLAWALLAPCYFAHAQADRMNGARQKIGASHMMTKAQGVALSTAELKSYIDGVRRRLAVAPGLGIAVVKGDRVIVAEGFGYRDVEAKLPVTPQTQFYIASTTKSFTATAARLLADEGKLDLDAPIKTYFPALKLPAPLSPEQISVRDLLTHRHGIRNEFIEFRTAYTGQYTTDEIFSLLSTESAAIAPTFRYSNLGYILAGYAMERATGETWQKVIETRILAPLNLRNTTCYASRVEASGNYAHGYLADAGRFTRLPYKKDNTMHAAGGMVSSAEDLGRWLVMNMNMGKFAGKQFIKASSLEEILSPQIDQKQTFYKFERYAYGLGWNIGNYEGEKLLHCFGTYEGFRPHVSFMPSQGLGVVVLTNESREAFSLPDLIATDIYDHLLGKRKLSAEANPKIDEYLARLEKDRKNRGEREATRMKEKNRSLAPALELAAYSGTYRNPQYGAIVIRVEGNNLVAGFGNLSATLEHYAGDAFQMTLIAGNSQKLVFKASKPDGVTALSVMGQTFTRQSK